MLNTISNCTCLIKGAMRGKTMNFLLLEIVDIQAPPAQPAPVAQLRPDLWPKFFHIPQYYYLLQLIIIWMYYWLLTHHWLPNAFRLYDVPEIHLVGFALLKVIDLNCLVASGRSFIFSIWRLIGGIRSEGRQGINRDELNALCHLIGR